MSQLCDKRTGPPVSCESQLLWKHLSQRNALIRLLSLSWLKFVVGGCTARRRWSPVPHYKSRIDYQAFPHDPPRVFFFRNLAQSAAFVQSFVLQVFVLLGLKSSVVSGHSDLAASPQSHFRIPRISPHFPALAADDIKQCLGCCKV